MQKLLNLLFFTFFCLFSGIFGSCTDDVTENNTVAYATFSLDSISLSPDRGEMTLSVEWSATTWEIRMEEESEMITQISPTSGGNRNKQYGQNQITVHFSENSTEKRRTQVLFLVNMESGERSQLTLIQDSRLLPLSIQPDKSVRYQYVYGFGGMYNPKIWLSPDNLITGDELLKMYSPEGLGYNILRLMIYPEEADWSADVEGARLAQQQGAIVIAAPWDCTDAYAEKITLNGREYKHLKQEYYQDYANHLIRYIHFMKDHGINLYAVSVQNEPDMEFTFWHPEEVVTFVKEHGASIRETGVKLMAPEACGMSAEYTDPVLNDPVAFEQTDIIAGHLYQGFIRTEESSYVKNRHDYIVGLYNGRLAAAGKSWWMTEHLFNDGEKESNPALWQFQDWSYNLETLAQEIHMCMEGYCRAYLYWYLKRFYGMIGDHDARSAAAPGEVLKNGYILSHYAKYASGMSRIKVEVGAPDVKATAYINDEETEISIVLLNMKPDDWLGQISFPGTISQISALETTAERNMQPTTATVGSDNRSATVKVAGNSMVSVRMKVK